MGKIVKGVALYTLVLIGILILLGAFIFGLMFFIPGFTPFGFGAINLTNNNEDTWDYSINLRESVAIDYDNGTSDVYGSEVKVYDVIIDAGEFDVQVVCNPELDSFIRMRVKENIFGLVRGDKEVSLDTDLEIYQDPTITDGARNKLKISMIYPTTGWVAFRDSTLYVEVPAASAYNLTIQTTSGDILLKGNENGSTITGLKIDTLDVETEDGDLDVEKLSAVDAGGNQNVTFSSLTLKTTGGEFDFTPIAQLSVMTDSSTTGTLVIDANKGDFYFNKLYSAIIILGDDVSITATEVKTGGNPFTYRATNGYFDIGTIDTVSDQLVTIVTNNANIDIGKIMGSGNDTNNNCQETSAIIATTYGDINLTEVLGKAKLTSTHGNINVGLITNAVSASSTYGDITLKYEGKASLVNVNGSINAEFVVSSADSANYTKVQSAKGSVTLTNQVNNLIAIGSESAIFNITFNKLYFGDAFDAASTSFAPATHTITMKGSSTASISVPLAEYPIVITPVGDTAEKKAANVIYSNLVTGQSRITADKTVAGKLTSSTGSGCAMTLSASAGGSITLNSYNKDALLTATTNSWFDLYVYTTGDPAVALFPIKYYYDETYRHEYSSSDTEEIDFRWSTSQLSANTKMAVANSTINLRTVSETAIEIPSDVSVVFRSKLYACGLFVQNNSGLYKKVGENYILLTEEEKNSESGSYVDPSVRYAISDVSTLTLPVETNGSNKTITFYVASDFDGTATYVKMIITLVSIVEA